MMHLLLAIHLISTVAMAGLIWFVQIVHYPLFAKVGRESFADYEAAHTRRTTWVAAPLMLLEAGTAVALVILVPPGVPATLAWVGAVLVGLLWACTAFLQVPCHRQLSRGFAEAAWRRLVSSNWLRTALWSVRAVLIAILAAVLSA